MQEIIKTTPEQLILQDKQKKVSIAMELPLSLQRYALSRLDDKVIDIEVPDAVGKIYDIIIQAMINNGNKKDTEDRDLVLNIADQCYTLVSTKYPVLTFEEIKFALFNLVDGQYCERDARFTINLSSISIAFKGFLNERQRSQAWQEMEAKQAPKPEISPEQKDAIVKTALIDLFNSQRIVYEQTKNRFDMKFPQISFVYYDYLKEKQLLNFTEAKRTYIYNRAVNIFKADVNKKVFERKYKRDFADAIMETINQNGPFKNLCRLEALREYFVDLMDNKKDLEEILTDNQ